MIYKENRKKLGSRNKCEMSCLKFSCLFSREDYDNASKFKKLFEDKINKNYKLKKSKRVKDILANR